MLDPSGLEAVRAFGGRSTTGRHGPRGGPRRPHTPPTSPPSPPGGSGSDACDEEDDCDSREYDGNCAQRAEQRARCKIEDQGNKPAQNGWKRLHCMVNCEAQKECGPLATPLITLGGIYHEIETGPIGLPPMFGFPGGGSFDDMSIPDWIFDTAGDLIANPLGQLFGLLPGTSCEEACGLTDPIPGPDLRNDRVRPPLGSPHPPSVVY